jgi:dUTP pyrophosphatase
LEAARVKKGSVENWSEEGKRKVELTLPGVLSREQIRERIQGEPPLVAGWGDLEEQLQPNGFDLRLAEIQRHRGRGTIGISNEQRVLPALEPVEADAEGFVDLTPGTYHVTYEEVVSLPKNLMALGRPRSSLARSGVAIHTAVWDAGYSGRSTSLLSVLNPAGFRLQIGARILQLVFFGLAAASNEGYQGIYQGENAR